MKLEPESPTAESPDTKQDAMPSSDKFGTGLGDQILLDKIDKLFAYNVGSYIDLPQLVVVGDQSSGKSSVLEALTGVPFPRDSGLCTRFATQIVFRRSETTKVTVTIIPAKDASEEHAKAVTSWHRADLENLDAASFGDIMKEATRVMGVSGSDNSGGGKQSTFSQDVLKLELTGPGRDHLSVIDVPGIFKNTTQGKTTKEDIALVREMVLSYMRNPRSVMLTLGLANVDIANQEILLMAHDVDPEGERTIGVLTKPDLVDPGSEGSVLDILAGKSNALALGWGVLRNPGQMDLGQTVNARNEAEMRFFKTQKPWNTVERDKVGVENLRLRLQRVLSGHIKREFPKVRAELQKRYADCQKQISDLGESRDNNREQLKYLHGIAKQFERITAMALNTEYSSDEAFNTYASLKIATIIRNRNEQFSNMSAELGQSYAFVGADDENGNKSRDEVDVRMQPLLDMVGDLAERSQPIDSPLEEGILDWLEELYIDSRGFELGTFQASILGNAMKVQSRDWDALAFGYINDVLYSVDRFIRDLLMHVCPDKRVRDAIELALFEKLAERYERAVEHVGFLLRVERKERPFTVANNFTTQLEDRRERQRQQRAEEEPSEANGKVHPNIKIDDHMIKDIHDILASYYEIARMRFADTLVMQAGGHFSVTGPESPLKLFSTEFIDSLSDDQLEEIAGEEPMRKVKRKQLLKELEDLEAGKKILRS